MKVNLVVRHTPLRCCCQHIRFYICSVLFDCTQIPISPLAELQVMSLFGNLYAHKGIVHIVVCSAVYGVTEYKDRVKYFGLFS